MLEGALCPNCAAPVSNTVVRANAPICAKCGVTITIIDGKLGFIRPYRILDPSITRECAENDLAVYRKHLMSYMGMQEDCKQKLKWHVERYAELPPPLQELELLKLEGVASSWKWLGFSLLWAPVGFFFGFIVSMAFAILVVIFRLIHSMVTDLPFNSTNNWDQKVDFLARIIMLVCAAAPFAVCLLNVLRVTIANGAKPLENARRRESYINRQMVRKQDVAAALKAAEPIKLREDFRLNQQIRELEGHIRTVKMEEAEVLRFLKAIKS